MREHLDADREQHERQRDLQVAEAVHRAGQREVERAQAEDREDVAREDQERVGGDREDGGDRVDGEDEVGRLDHDQRQRQRREHPLAAARPRHRDAAPTGLPHGLVRAGAHEEVLAVEAVGHGQEPPHQADDEVFRRDRRGPSLMNSIFTAVRIRNAAEDVQDPVEAPR